LRNWALRFIAVRSGGEEEDEYTHEQQDEKYAKSNVLCSVISALAYGPRVAKEAMLKSLDSDAPSTLVSLIEEPGACTVTMYEVYYKVNRLGKSYGPEYTTLQDLIHESHLFPTSKVMLTFA